MNIIGTAALLVWTALLMVPSIAHAGQSAASKYSDRPIDVVVYIAGALILIVIQTALIGWPLAEHGKRRRAEQARAQLAAIVASSGDAILGTSLDGVI